MHRTWLIKKGSRSSRILSFECRLTHLNPNRLRAGPWALRATPLKLQPSKIDYKDEDALACIAHKSLEICEQCRLRQQNSPATPENSAAFWREEHSLF